MAGRVLGTTDYVSPEQALGQPVTGQSDLYSLGVVLYEMLTGEVPFRGDSPVAVAMKHVREELPDVQERRPELSAATAAVVDRAVAKDLAERYPDAPSDGGRPRGRRSRWRPPARARRPARSPPCCARCPAARDGGCPGACAIRRAGWACSWWCWRPWRSVLWLAAGQTHRGTGVASRPGPPRRPRTRAAQPDGRPRLQPVRHGPGKPRPDPEPRRQRPEHHLEHRAVLRRHAAQARAGRGSGSTSTPRPRVRRKGDGDPDPDARLRRRSSTSPTASSRKLPYGSSMPAGRARLAGPGGRQRVGAQRRTDRDRGLPRPTATTSSG